MDIIDLDFVRQQRAEQAASATPVSIHSEIDPVCPDLAHHIITGDVEAAVQACICGMVAEVQQSNGFAHFTAPKRLDDFYYAEGETLVFP